jgi:tight adherence protein C
MMAALLQSLSGLTGLALVGGVAILVGGGLGLIGYSARLRGQLLSKRVSAMVPRAGRTTAIAVAAAPRPERSLMRLPSSMPDRERREIGRQFSKLGASAETAGTWFAGFRLLTVLGMAASAVVLAPHLPGMLGSGAMPGVLAAALGIIGWFAPLFAIRRLVKKRAKAVAAGLPDALELLVVCVEAGLALEDGIDRIALELKQSRPPLADELALTSADLKILPSRDQALANLADRVDVASVRSVVTTLSQTMRYGTPLAQAIRVVASEMRNESLIQLEERANRLPTMLTIPMMLFIMPTIFLVIGGPSALRLIDMIGH